MELPALPSDRSFEPGYHRGAPPVSTSGLCEEWRQRAEGRTESTNSLLNKIHIYIYTRIFVLVYRHPHTNVLYIYTYT